MMTPPRPSLFRDALQVSPERIANMTDGDLTEMMRALLIAQAYRCQAAQDEIRVNTEGRAKDGGCDGWSPKPGVDDAWLGSTTTCWQFKAGTAGQPSRIEDEVTKRIPSETLKDGGRFVLVASGLTDGRNGERARLDVLVREAATAGLPTERIEVLGSDQLATWCNQHPAIAARWAGRPNGLWILDEWSRLPVHQVPWQASESVRADIAARRADLDFEHGTVHHLHVQGPPGVGKTRFALELCRDAAWRSAVIYVQQADDIRLPELIDSASSDAGVRMVVVADEVQPERLRSLRDSVDRADGRIRLITLGQCRTPEPARIPAVALRPLDRQAVGEIVKGWYAAMPVEHVDFVARFADGYVRLARLAADAVAKSTTIDVRGLLGRDEIRAFLDGMLGSGNRRALYVVAILDHVGWTDDKQAEGEAVAKHLGLDWNDVRAQVDDFDRRLGIAPRGGRYRYISPTPLGIHLAVEAWTTYPDLLRSLPDVLPSEDARGAYYERLQAIASNPQARQFAREQLAFFFRLADAVDDRAVQRWSALAAADPDQAARNMLRALGDATVDERLRVAGRARREAVWALVRLAWRSSSFADSVKALALLAEAENETWGNNATGEFLARFQVYLGGTAVPYPARLEVLDGLLKERRPGLTRLVVKALSRVGERHASRMGSDPVSDELPEKEWHPSTGHDLFDCIRAAVARLETLAASGDTTIREDLVAAARDLAMLLRDGPVRGLVAGFFHTLRRSYPDTREQLRRAIADVIHRERKYWKDLAEEEVAELDALHRAFEDSSLSARLRQHVGHASWDRDEQPDLKPLAEEVVSSQSVLEAEWSWLTSGDAADAWRFGEALAEVDSQLTLAEVLPSLPGSGHDLRVICGYVSACRRRLGDDWYEEWVRAQLPHGVARIGLLFEAAWRCGATEFLARSLAETLRRGNVRPEIVGQLGFGRWYGDLPRDALEALLRAMIDGGHASTAIAILAHRLKDMPAEREGWAAMALELAATGALIRAGHMVSYYWKQVASEVVVTNAAQVAAAIIREQADRTGGTWFAEHSEAAQVLHACVEQDPAGVWRELLPQLASRGSAYLFSIGFPRGVLERVPREDVLAWVASAPEQRAALLAKLISKDFSTDESLASQLVGTYGHQDDVASSFFGEYVSGSWSGPASTHWLQLAESLDGVAARTSLPKLKAWALKGARALGEMADRDRQREEEEELKWR